MDNIDYSKCNIWELTTHHILAREKKHYITCEKIQAEIQKRPLNEQVLASKRVEYKPVEVKVELFRVA